MMYAYIDGDNIGLAIEKSFLSNSEQALKETNREVIRLIELITAYLENSDGTIIFSGADGIICKGNSLDGSAIITHIRSISSNITFSVGIGETLTDCFLALRYAKASNKNIAIIKRNDQFIKLS